MKCPNCSSHIASWEVLSDGWERVRCKKCHSTIRVRGLFPFVMAPMILFIAFPFQLLPQNVVLSSLVLGATGLLMYWLSFILFIRLKYDAPDSTTQP